MVKYNPDNIFNALGHPVRRRIVERLSRAEGMSLSEIAEPFSMSLPAVMKHALILEACGVIVSSKEGRTRHYSINTDSLHSGMSWFAAMEEVWEGRFNRLEQHLKADNKK